MKNFLEEKRKFDIELIKIFESTLRSKKIDGFVSFESLLSVIKNGRFDYQFEDVSYLVNIKDRATILNQLTKFCNKNNDFFIEEGGVTKLNIFEPDMFGNKEVLKINIDYSNWVTPKSMNNKVDIFYYAYLDDSEIEMLKKLYRSYEKIAKVLTRKKGGIKGIIDRKFATFKYNFVKMNIDIFTENICLKQTNLRGKKLYIFDYSPNVEAQSFSLYNKMEDLAIQNSTVSIPTNYSEILKREFGDYLEYTNDSIENLIHTYYDESIDESKTEINNENSKLANLLTFKMYSEWSVFLFDGKIKISESDKEKYNIKLITCKNGYMKMLIEKLSFPIKFKLDNAEFHSSYQYLGKTKYKLVIIEDKFNLYKNKVK